MTQDRGGNNKLSQYEDRQVTGMKDWNPSTLKVILAKIAFSLVSLWLIAFYSAPARAESLENLLPYVIENHDRVRASKAKLTAARNRAREALGAWYPTLGQTLNAGTEKQQNDNGADSSTGFNEWDISLTQLLWDFGSTNAAVDKARLKIEEARYNLIETRQTLILEAITAYMNTIRTYAGVKFAKDSEENIRRQTGLEEAMVVLGSGFSTDVLQAKTQLAGAQARRAQSEGGFLSALSRFKAVYGIKPDHPESLETVPYPAAYLPQTLTQATDIAFETNPALKNAILASDIAVEDVRAARADKFGPKFNATAERKFKKNVSGTIGSEQETLAKVEMKFDFNLGFTAVNTLRASESDLSATTYTAADTRRKIEEQVSNAWQQLDTAKKTASHLNNQANIAEAFLELARNERQLGRRSLIDVLSGETNLINAKSDALSAETDVIIAAYGLLAATGQLEYEVIKNSKGVVAPTAIIRPSAPSAESPAAAPTLPVTPATGQINGEIEPDVTVSDGRSVADFQAAFTSLDKTNVNALPDVVVAYGKTGSGLPAPKSRYDSFDQFKPQGGNPVAVASTPEPEFASRDQTSTYPAQESRALPSDSDTVAASAAKQKTADADVTAGQPNVPAVTPKDEDVPVVAPQEIAEVSSAASAAAPVEQPFNLSQLFDILETAHQAALEDQAQKANAYASMPVSDHQKELVPAPVEVAAIETIPAETENTAVPIETAVIYNDPLSTLFGNIASFMEQVQSPTPRAQDVNAVEKTSVEITDPDLNIPAMDHLEVANVEPAIELPSEPAHTPAQQPDAQKPVASSPLADLFSFLEAAHQRALEEQNAHLEKPDPVAVAEPAKAPAPTELKHAANTVKSGSPNEAPELGMIIGKIFGSDKGLAGISFEPSNENPYKLRAPLKILD